MSCIVRPVKSVSFLIVKPGRAWMSSNNLMVSVVEDWLRARFRNYNMYGPIDECLPVYQLNRVQREWCDNTHELDYILKVYMGPLGLH